ncbi:hypothetical protein [Mesorhizobium album]|uniref:hypothetical protein n=1 Tax=Mesorhizobium album TaxID=3072314 RepID=UPI003D31704E
MPLTLANRFEPLLELATRFAANFRCPQSALVRCIHRFEAGTSAGLPSSSTATIVK